MPDLVQSLSRQHNLTYEKVNASEEGLLSEGDSDYERYAKSSGNLPRWTQDSSSSRRMLIIYFLNSVIFGVSIIFFIMSVTSQRPSSSVNAAVEMTTGYSPLLRDINLNLKSVYLNGTLYPPKHQFWGRKTPGDREAEDKWESYERTPVFPITREDIIKMGKDPETAVRFPDEHFGLGDQAYVASLDVTHKIHCLNELRKMTFARHPTDDGKPVFYSVNDSDLYSHERHGHLWWYHLRHCTDMLLQDLLCHADAHLITYQFRDTQIHPFPDFGIKRECRDLEQLIKYRDKHAVDLDKYVEVVRYEEGKGTKLIPYEKTFYDRNGFVGSTLFPNGEGYEEWVEKTWV